MGRLKAIGFTDPCFGMTPVQPVTWRNWQEQGIQDLSLCKHRVIGKLAALPTSPNQHEIGIGRDMLDAIPEIATCWLDLMGHNIRFNCTEHGGLALKSPLFNLNASQLVSEWNSLGDYLKYYLLLSTWYGLTQHKSAFNRHHPQFQLAGMVAVCYCIGVTTSTG